MTTIYRAIIRIDIEKYAEGINSNPGFIDGSATFPEASEIRVSSVFDNNQAAESEIDRTVYLEISDTDVVIDYEFIPESEEVYFNRVKFCGKIYPLDSCFYSPDCYEAVKKCIGEL